MSITLARSIRDVSSPGYQGHQRVIGIIRAIRTCCHTESDVSVPGLFGLFRLLGLLGLLDDDDDDDDTREVGLFGLLGLLYSSGGCSPIREGSSVMSTLLALLNIYCTLGS